jgi:hypothetical protein
VRGIISPIDSTNILKMGGRKFYDGKVKLQTLLNQFEEEGK